MKITARNVDRLQHVAISRLTLYVAGRIHALIEPFQAWLVKQVQESADADGAVDPGRLWCVIAQVETRWRAVMAQYVALLRAGREQAGDIAFESLKRKNNAQLDKWVTKPGMVESLQESVALAESFQPTTQDWIQLARMWLRRRNYALVIAQERVWSDGLNLSQRIWRLENGGMQVIRTTLARGMAERTNAWELATQLENVLGADRDFPRWTEERLYALTPSDRAQSQAGLLRAGDPLLPGESRGVSYNALRLARTEIQYANHAVTSEIAQHFPGITGRYVRLSPEHPVSDICDDYAAGGPYDVNDNILPLHPQCMCYYEEALMPAAQFTRQVSGWVNGQNTFLDGYNDWLGMRAAGPWPARMDLPGVMELWSTMEMWMDNNVDAMATAIKI